MTTTRSHGQILGAAILALAWVAACGGSTGSDSGQVKCVYGGASYSPGQSFSSTDGCNSCSCQPDGSVACTTADCAAACIYQGSVHAPGQTFPAGDGCNSCSCDVDGSVSCTEADCSVTCEHDGMVYVPGQSFPAGDGCNDCICQDNGQVSCTFAYCAPSCTYAGQTYPEGASFPALDGCNTCTCTGGAVSCTEKLCPCAPDAEWWRDYVGLSPAECAVLKYACPANTTPFSNACGCGCEQSPECPPVIDCKPPNPCDPDLIAQCPYSSVAK